MRPCTRSPVFLPFSFPTFVLLTQMIVRGLWVSGSPRCASCGFPALTKDAEEKLMIEVAKQQLLDKLHLKERPNITQAVPRAALLTALRKLHSGRARPNRTPEQENNLSKKDQSYEVVSFADLRKSGIPLSYTHTHLHVFSDSKRGFKAVLRTTVSKFLFTHECGHG